MKSGLIDIARRHGLNSEVIAELEALIESADEPRQVAPRAGAPMGTMETVDFEVTQAGGDGPPQGLFHAAGDMTLDSAVLDDGRRPPDPTPAPVGPGNDMTLDSDVIDLGALAFDDLRTSATVAFPDGAGAPASPPLAPASPASGRSTFDPGVLPSDPSGLGLEVGDVFGPEGRYEDMGVLGYGGMGEVRRVRDRKLGRTLAFKTIHPEVLEQPRSALRFIEEAQIGAQLQHPGVIPVYDIGRLPDGRYYFTMREVKGRDLNEVIFELHHASDQAGQWTQTPSGWTFRRLINAFWQTCETMAYAHRRRIIHRDLKPANIMIGQDDEVLVVDWGLALALDRPVQDEAPAPDIDAPVQTLRTLGAMGQTRFGSISGTPSYMPPEQAQGNQAALDARSDVYALGAVLYQILTGQPPYTGGVMQVLARILRGPPPPPDHISPFPLPQELVEICMRALAHDKDARFDTARQMADAVVDWIDGVRQREEALGLVAEAEEHQRRAAELLTSAHALEARGHAMISALPPHAPALDKLTGWALEDEADQQGRQAELELIRAEQKLRGALIHASDLPEAHEALALRYEQLHREAEAAKDERRAQRAELVLRDHVLALPGNHPQRERLEAYLQGTGALTLVTDVPGVEVRLRRYEIQNRRLVPGMPRALGSTPLVAVPVEPGSYLIELHKPGFEPVRYPIFIDRGSHWDGVPPEGREPSPIWMPPVGSLGADECYVPAGWSWFGGDPLSANAVSKRRVWCDAFTIERHPVTNARMIAFLDALVDSGQEEEALRCVPRERGLAGDMGAMLYGRDAQGHFFLQADEDGDIWEPEYPVIMINLHSARSFAQWSSRGGGVPWRLPLDFEWEKAARGVDGRIYPWGDWLDPSWCCMRASHKGKPLPAEVERYPGDVSAYGMRGAAGNVMDMCLNLIDEIPDDGQAARVEPRMLDEREGNFTCRGGTWIYPDTNCRLARRHSNPHTMRQSLVGFRLARSV